MPEQSPEERFEDLIDEFISIDGVSPPMPGRRRFGSGTLRYNGHIFAMFVRGALVLKLPAPRVTDLVEDNQGTPFDANKGTPMKEWLSLSPDATVDWSALTREALTFAQAQPPARRR